MKFLLTAANTTPAIRYSLTTNDKIRKAETPSDFVKRVLGKEWAFIEFEDKNKIVVVPLFFAKKKDGSYAKNPKAHITKQLKVLVSKGWVKETIIRKAVFDYSGRGGNKITQVFDAGNIRIFKYKVKDGIIRGELGVPKKKSEEGDIDFIKRYTTINEDNTVIKIHSADFNKARTIVSVQYSVLVKHPKKKQLEKLLDSGKLVLACRCMATMAPGDKVRNIFNLTTFDLKWTNQKR